MTQILTFAKQDRVADTLLAGLSAPAQPISSEVRCAPAGTTLQVWNDFFWHYGIYDGQGGVIHKAKGRAVSLEPLEKFASGRNVLIASNIASPNLGIAYQKAYSRIGEGYSTIANNCEHFVRDVHDLPKESKQLQKYVFGGVLAFVLSRVLAK
ncbi:MAG: lecithin retinol acyltransferase family protein [Gammaproteobacteria bacterium]